MNFEFTGRHMEVTEALRAHLEEHFARIENVFNGKPASAHVIIEVERGRHRSEIIINWRNETLTAESTNSDMYLSLTQSINKIEKQARKLKDKVIDKSHRAIKAAAVISSPADQTDIPVQAPRVIEMDGVETKPMTVDEAVLELDDGDQQFHVFRNSEGGKVAVIFRRKDGNYGLVQP
ncbi:MAG: ribosome hibernation-promoting factor, HPF/YfiA family [Pyrinomonadaceae bacterium]